MTTIELSPNVYTTVVTVTDDPRTWPGPEQISIADPGSDRFHRCEGRFFRGYCKSGRLRGWQWYAEPIPCSGADGCCQDEVGS